MDKQEFSQALQKIANMELPSTRPRLHLGCGMSEEAVIALAVRFKGEVNYHVGRCGDEAEPHVLFALRECYVGGIEIEAQGARPATNEEVAMLAKPEACRYTGEHVHLKTVTS